MKVRIEIINNDKNINNKIKNIINIYNKMNNNFIKTKIYEYGKYIGELKNNKREGKGIMYYNDGDRYEGGWKNDKKEGKGIMYYNDGDRQMGDCFDGHPIGKHVLFKNNGEIEIINY